MTAKQHHQVKGLGHGCSYIFPPQGVTIPHIYVASCGFKMLFYTHPYLRREQRFKKSQKESVRYGGSIDVQSLPVNINLNLIMSMLK